MKRVHDGYTFLVVILIFQSVSRPILHWTAVRSIGHRKIISNISARGHCGLNVFADSERLGMISSLSYIMSKWPNCTVWKLLITEVLAVTSLLGRKKRRFLGSKTPLKYFFTLRIPKRHFLVSKRVVWAINHQYRFRRSTCVRAQEKKGMDGWMETWIKLKKGQKCYISRMCPEVPRQPNATKICIYYDANDVITCAKFGDDWFRGFLLPAVQKCPFPIKVVVTITTACTSVQPW